MKTEFVMGRRSVSVEKFTELILEGDDIEDEARRIA
jgi:hypothetical protein